MVFFFPVHKEKEGKKDFILLKQKDNSKSFGRQKNKVFTTVCVVLLLAVKAHNKLNKIFSNSPNRFCKFNKNKKVNEETLSMYKILGMLTFRYPHSDPVQYFDILR